MRGYGREMGQRGKRQLPQQKLGVALPFVSEYIFFYFKVVFGHHNHHNSCGTLTIYNGTIELHVPLT